MEIPVGAAGDSAAPNRVAAPARTSPNPALHSFTSRTTETCSHLTHYEHIRSQTLYAVEMEAYVAGVSTRPVDDLVAALGSASGISKSEVSQITAQGNREIVGSIASGRSFAPDCGGDNIDRTRWWTSATPSTEQGVGRGLLLLSRGVSHAIWYPHVPLEGTEIVRGRWCLARISTAHVAPRRRRYGTRYRNGRFTSQAPPASP